MIRETARTRALRRAQHDTYAPFIVRPAVRGGRPPRDLFEWLEPHVQIWGIVAIVFVVASIFRWALH